MNTHRYAALVAAVVIQSSALAVDWQSMSHSPAQIEVLNMRSVPLAESADKNGWAKIPAALSKFGAVVYMPAENANGVADIKVTADGYLLVACNYDYQGNKQGKWDEEAWDAKKFKTKGWHELSKHELEGELVKGDNRMQTIFVKQVKKGEAFRLRCNKYDPPYPILLSAGK